MQLDKQGGYTKGMKKLFSVLMSAFLLFSLVPLTQAQTTSFKDVPSSYTFYEEIQYLVDLEIITGFEDGTFKPNQAVTRAQAAIMLGRASGLNGEQKTTIFSDVPASSVASGYIQEAFEWDIILGYPDGTFRPNESVTRGQMAILLSRTFDLEWLLEMEENTESNVSFKDVSVASAAYPYISQLVNAGITYGYEDNTFKPNEAVTRGQFSAFMSRTYDYMEQLYGDEDIYWDEESWTDEDIYWDEELGTDEEVYSDEEVNVEEISSEKNDMVTKQ